MTLNEALYVLATTHTRPDSAVGFVIMAGAHPEHERRWTVGQYTEAWRVVRDHIGLSQSHVMRPPLEG